MRSLIVIVYDIYLIGGECNLGDHKLVARGIWEARVMFGPGYRIYFAKAGDSMVLLLGGGDKKTQQQDIWRAQTYWADYSRSLGDAETQR